MFDLYTLQMSICSSKSRDERENRIQNMTRKEINP